MDLKILLLLIAGAYAAFEEQSIEEITILSADRQIDLTTQLVRINSKLKLENNGAKSVKSVLYTIDTKMSGHISYIGAFKDSKVLNVKRVSVASRPDLEAYSVQLPGPLSQGKVVEIEVEFVATHLIKAFPEEITQKEKQLVKFIGNHYLYSPYNVNKQTAKLTLSTRNVESYTKLKPSSQSDNTVTYGPYENVAPLSYSECVVHYENNNAFLTVAKLERTIEVSHWGNIAVEEKIEIVHTGAKLKGSFSRFDFQREPNSGLSSVKAFKTVLPASAKDIYYRDDVGNISTSNMWPKHDSVELTLRPRFPLFGGWKTRYVIGYNTPSYEYLFSDDTLYLLQMRLVDHVYDSMVVDELSVKFILPEGSSNIKVNPPYPVKELPRSLHFTYLDVFGRPVITLEKSNVVENHIQDISIEYSFPKIYMLREPLIVVVAFLVLFITVLIYVRLDFSIASGKSGKSSVISSALAENVMKRHSKRVAVYENFDSHLNKLKTNKDVSPFQAAFKAMTAEHKSETQAINEILNKCKAESLDLSHSINDLQKLDRGLWEVYVAYGQALEKFVIGKMTRQQIGDQENMFNKKRDEIVENTNSIIKSM